ncbi:hypothetical protein GCM10022630_20600 [Thermobifida alba]
MVADDEVVDLTLVVSALADRREGVFAQQVGEYLWAVFVHVLDHQVDSGRIGGMGFYSLPIVPITPPVRGGGILVRNGGMRYASGGRTGCGRDRGAAEASRR